MADWIGIREVLSEIYTSPEPFALTLVTAEGRVSEKSSVRLGGARRSQRKRQGRPDPPTRKGRRIKKGHLLLLYDNHEHHPFYVRICLLTYWNGQRIRHYYGKSAHPTI